MMLSPAYAYEKAPDQEHFPGVTQSRKLFSEAFADGNRKRWRLNHTPLFLDFLEGKVDFQCTPWGIPSYSIFGWQRPCYLMSDGYVATYKELIETTDWSKYGRGNDPRCDNCMAHCGYEPTAVLAATKSLQAVAARARLGLAPLSAARHARQHVGDDRLGLALELKAGVALGDSSRRKLLVGRRADHHAVDRRLALEPRAEVDRVAEDAVDAMPAVADDAGQHLAGVDAAAEVRPVRAAGVGPDLGRGALQREPARAARTAWSGWSPALLKTAKIWSPTNSATSPSNSSRIIGASRPK